MIRGISGYLISRGGNRVVLDVNGLEYEVLVPAAVMGAIEEVSVGEKVSLVTYHYLQLEPSRGMPILVGFSNEIEKEFFEQFISVASIGPKTAVKALTIPFSQIARAIDEGDVAALRRLPGIGAEKARQVIAKLQGKVGKYALIRTQRGETPQPATEDIADEAMEILRQLRYTEAEARRLVTKAQESAPGVDTTEALLEEIYRQGAYRDS